MYMGVHMRQRHRNDSATEKKKKRMEEMARYRVSKRSSCLRYCRSLNGKISASAFGGHLYRDTTNFARVVNY